MDRKLTRKGKTSKIRNRSKNSTIREHFRFSVRFRLLWIHPNIKGVLNTKFAFASSQVNEAHRNVSSCYDDINYLHRRCNVTFMSHKNSILFSVLNLIWIEIEYIFWSCLWLQKMFTDFANVTNNCIVFQNFSDQCVCILSLLPIIIFPVDSWTAIFCT